MLRELIDRRVIILFRADLIDIVDYIGAIAIGRDKIIHGTWSSHQPPPPLPDEPRPSDETTHVSTTAKPRTAFDWRISYDRTIAAAPKIDAASSRLSNYLASVVGKPSLFLMSDALRRISRPPDSGSQNRVLALDRFRNLRRRYRTGPTVGAATHTPNSAPSIAST